jgi:hypothetical protein
MEEESMQKLSVLWCVPFLAVGLAAYAAPAHAGSAPPGPEKVLVKMIEAVKAHSYDAFLADADDNLKRHLSHQQFDELCERYATALKKGYEMEYFGQLRQNGMVVYVWKVSSPGAQDDALVKLVMKDGKVSGIWVS